VTVIRGEDWVGIYRGTKLVYQGHSANPEIVVEALGLTYASYTANEEWLDRSGRFPEDLENVVTL
jgi:hypothetical protein